MIGVPRDASPEAIKRAYRALSRKLHPDRTGSNTSEAFARMRRAHEVLSDPERRREHDAELVARERGAEPLAWPGEPFGGGLEELVLALLGQPPGRRRRAGPAPRRVALDVWLSPMEAATGVAVSVPMPEPWSDVDAQLFIAPGAQDGAVTEVPLALADGTVLVLVVHVRVGWFAAAG
jgi:DnaJ-class molecular chaperone